MAHRTAPIDPERLAPRRGKPLSRPRSRRELEALSDWPLSDPTPPPIVAPEPVEAPATIARVLDEDWGSIQSSSREGAASPNAALSSEVVRRIRERYAAGIPTKDLAAEYGVSIATIGRIIAGKTYRNADTDIEAPPVIEAPGPMPPAVAPPPQGERWKGPRRSPGRRRRDKNARQRRDYRRRWVQWLAGKGIPADHIAVVLGIDQGVVDRHLIEPRSSSAAAAPPGGIGRNPTVGHLSGYHATRARRLLALGYHAGRIAEVLALDAGAVARYLGGPRPGPVPAPTASPSPGSTREKTGRPPKLDDDGIRRLLALRAAGFYGRELAEACGISIATVTRILARSKPALNEDRHI